MSARDISVQLRRQVVERAGERCEYCLMPDRLAFYPPEIDHIIAVKHGGHTEFSNLARVCWRCNRRKGTDIASLDPESGDLTRLFNPRTDNWNDHFRLQGPRLVSDTPVGRATISLLQLNETDRQAERSLLIAAGQYP